MQILLFNALCLILATTVADEQPPDTKGANLHQRGTPTVFLPFENLNIFDALPGYTTSMSDEMFMKWAKAQNKMAYRKAQQRADEWNARNPALDYYIQENEYSSNSDLNQNETGSSTNATVNSESNTDYDGTNIQRTHRSADNWGGGPVIIINPYYRGKP